MPLLAFSLGKVFGLSNELLVGVVLVGTCPGGTSSNVITYLSKGDTALSVGMTSINTLLAPFLTPALTYLYLRTTVSVDVKSMFVSIIQVVIIPIGLGLMINKLLGRYTQKISDVLPTVSVTAICLIVAAVVSHNSGKTCPGKRLLLLRSVCRTRGLRQRLPGPLFRTWLWRQYRERSFLYGTISPARYWREC